jgi:iron complex transport system substrate-binding protein
MTRCIFVLLCALAAAHPAQAEAPRRVVSFNICADQLVVALAAPEQIAGLSPYATDPTLSGVASLTAQAFRRLQWHAESTIPLDPDLVLVGPRDRSVTQRMLTSLGFRVVSVDFVSTIAAAREQIRTVAALLGHPERGEQLLARLDAARARLASAPRPPVSTALLVGHGGYTEGSATLAAALIAEARLVPPAGAPRGMGGFVPLEAW